MRTPFLIVFTILFFSLAAQDSTKAITGKHFHLGAGVSNYSGNTSDPYNPFLTTDFGFDWSIRKTKLRSIEFGWSTVKYRYNGETYLHQNHQYSGWYGITPLYADKGVDIHLMNWFHPFQKGYMKLGVGGSLDILLVRYSTSTEYSNEFLLSFWSFNQEVKLQPCALFSLSTDPKSFHRFTPEIIGRCGLFTIKGRGTSAPTAIEINAHRWSVMFRVNVNVDMSAQQKRKQNRKKVNSSTPHIESDSTFSKMRSERYALYAEVFGAGAYGSTNADFLIFRSQYGRNEIRLRTGLGFLDKPGLVVMPTFSCGTGKVRPEFGSGFTYFPNDLWITFAAGARFETKSGFFARLTYSPMFMDVTRGGDLFPVWFGASVGMHR